MLHVPKQNGFVILIVLFFMQALMLLNWYSIENVFLFLKFNKNISSHNLMYYQAENLLADIESAAISNLPDCIIDISATDQLVKKPLIWWQSQACSGNFHEVQYYYVIEPLTIDYCAIIEPVKKTGVEYFRITLLIHSNREGARFFFQSTWIRPAINTQPCKGIQHSVELGRQSWRELDY